MAGFEWVYRRAGAGPTIKNALFTAGTLHKGDFVSLLGGTVRLSVAADTNIYGLCIANAVGGPTVRVPVIIDEDSVYSVADANIRVAGATLDLAGATGAQSVAASASKTFVVVDDKGSTGVPTKVRINVGKSTYNTAL